MTEITDEQLADLVCLPRAELEALRKRSEETEKALLEMASILGVVVPDDLLPGPVALAAVGKLREDALRWQERYGAAREDAVRLGSELDEAQATIKDKAHTIALFEQNCREWLAWGTERDKEVREAEIARLRSELHRWEEREAAVCPEDVGFEEVIARLREFPEKVKQEAKALRDEQINLRDTADRKPSPERHGHHVAAWAVQELLRRLGLDKEGA